jgi:hypothetical protein
LDQAEERYSMALIFKGLLVKLQYSMDFRSKAFSGVMLNLEQEQELNSMAFR